MLLYMERLPFQATVCGAPYESLGNLPAVVLLDNVRSLDNAGAFFRICDAVAAEVSGPARRAALSERRSGCPTMKDRYVAR